jgi:hypothetical protein
MKKTEAVDMGLDITILVSSILNGDSTPEEVANTAVTFVSTILRKYPELRGVVDSIICSYDKDDSDFNAKWDRQIAWMKFEKDMISGR